MESQNVKKNSRTKKIILSILALIMILSIGVFSVQAIQNGKVTKFVEIGNKYLLDGRYEQAIVEFDYALKINRKNVAARVGLTKAYIGLKNYDKAVVVLKEGIRILPKEPLFYLMLSDVYMIKGDTENAIKTLLNGYDDTENLGIKNKLNEIKSTISIIVEKNILQVGNNTTTRLVQSDKDGNVIKELNAEWQVKESKVGSINKIDSTKASYKGIAIGEDEVIASIAKAQFRKPVEVKGVVLQKLEINGGGAVGKVGDTMKFNVVGYDQMGKVMEVVPTWSINNDIAELVKTEGQIADVSYVKDGTFELTAAVGDINQKISVTLQNKKYSVITIISGKGSITKNPSENSYREDKNVTLTAVPSVGWHFTKWTGSLTGSSNPVVINIDGNKEIHAIFEIDQNELKTEVSGLGNIGRSVNKNTYAYGEVVRLTASPINEYRFDHWEGDISGTNPVVDVTMNGYKQAKAVFVKNQYTLGVQVSGKGQVNRSSNKSTYDYGTTIKLTAVPGERAVFSHWEGDLSGAVNPIEILLSKNKNVKAVFDDVMRVSGKITNSKDKTSVTSAKINIRTSKDNKTGKIYKSINSNEIGEYDITLLKRDYTFEVIKSGFTTQYTNVIAGNDDLIRDIVLNKLTEQEIYKLTVEVVGKGSVKQEDAGLNKIKLTATPGENSVFSHWEGDLNGTVNPVEITLFKNENVKAVFDDLIKVSGKLTNSKNQTSVTNAVINIRTSKNNKTGEIYKTINSNDLGQYDIRLLKGDYTFEVIKSGFTTQYNNVIVENDDLTNDIVLNQVAEQEIYNLEVDVIGKGTVKQEDVGVNKIKLTAIPGEKAIFSHWEVDLSGEVNPVEITLDKNKSVKAVFVDIMRVSGKITNSIDQTSIANTKINIRTSIDNKTGEIYKIINSNEIGQYDTTLLKGSYTFEVIKSEFTTKYSNVIVESNDLINNIALDQIIYKLTVQDIGHGISKEEEISVNKVKLTATPGENAVFSHWEGDLTGATNPVEITLDKNATVKAIYYDLVKVSGKVMNAKDQSAITNTAINIRTGSDTKIGEVYKTINTNGLGLYDVKLSKGNYTFEVIKDGFTTEYTNVTVGTVDMTRNIVLNQVDKQAKFRIVLTWGEEPKDLDSYLLVPVNGGSDYKEVYYNNKSVMDSDNENETATLDTDDTNGYGPETTTILSMETGKYSYYVKDYSNSGTMNTSNALAKVYKNNLLVNTFNIPTGGEVADNRNYWHVFNIINGEVVPVNITQSDVPQY